jgi:hypothetical protein
MVCAYGDINTIMDVRYLNRIERYPSVAPINKTNILTEYPVL